MGMELAAEVNWAGNQRYSAARVLRPQNVEELQGHVAQAQRVKAMGSRHSFNTIADTSGDLVELSGLPRGFELSEDGTSVTVDAGMRYGELARRLQEHGRALPNMASLPHITVAGSVATGTHGSGDRLPPLSAAVRAVELVLSDGSLHTLRRGDADFGAAVVNLGALGVVVRLSLDTVPSFQVRQDVYDGLSWEAVQEGLDELTGSAYSVSLFTRWSGEHFGHAWLKSVDEPPQELAGIAALRHNIGLVEGAVERTTEQSGSWGTWDQRLPHFKLDFTPSNGSELQSEYLLPREQAPEAVRRLRALGELMGPHLLLSEIRTMSADDQWMSPASGRDTVGFHFTWRQHLPQVEQLLPQLEEALLPLGARAHWGKLAAVPSVGADYPQLEAFREAARRLDPRGAFRNDFLDQHVFG